MQPPFDSNRSPYTPPTTPVGESSYPQEPYGQYPPQQPYGAQPPYPPQQPYGQYPPQQPYVGYQQPYPPQQYGQYPPQQPYGAQQPVAYGAGGSPYAVPQGDPNASGRWKRWFGFNIIALYIAVALLAVGAQMIAFNVLATGPMLDDDPATLLDYWNSVGWIALGFFGAIAGVLLSFLHRGALHNTIENKQLWFGVTVLGSAVAFPLVMYAYVSILISGFKQESGGVVLLAHMVAGFLAAVCIGVPQMFVMRERVRDSWQWVAVMAGTWMLFMTGTIGALMALITNVAP